MKSNKQAFQDYLQFEKKYSPHTVNAYLNDLGFFEEFNKERFEQDSIERVNYSQIRSWIVFLVDQGVSNVSVNRKMASLKAFYKFLLKIKQIEVSPMLKHKALKTPKIVQIPFSEKEVSDLMFGVESPIGFEEVRDKLALNLPLFPTTTIGSFPQTTEVRSWRAKFKKGELTTEQYNDLIEKETEAAIRFQEETGIDVLVHGEFERNDMVEYFGEQLDGFTFTKNGWVQSYGSRCVKPPVIYGDVSRPNPMTVKWSKYAQSLTSKWVKGMLTGPVTILQWSFVRNDQPRSETCTQIALAVRDEVVDLEKAGIKIIQIDEPAIREGLPLRKEEWAKYLDWAVKA